MGKLVCLKPEMKFHFDCERNMAFLGPEQKYGEKKCFRDYRFMKLTLVDWIFLQTHTLQDWKSMEDPRFQIVWFKFVGVIVGF